MNLRISSETRNMKQFLRTPRPSTKKALKLVQRSLLTRNFELMLGRTFIMDEQIKATTKNYLMSKMFSAYSVASH